MLPLFLIIEKNIIDKHVEVQLSLILIIIMESIIENPRGQRKNLSSAMDEETCSDEVEEAKESEQHHHGDRNWLAT